MTALTADRAIKRRTGDRVSIPVAAGVKIFIGAGVVRNSSGYAAPASSATGLISAGVSNDYVDNTTGADGAQNVLVEPGIWTFNNSASTDLITIAEVGDQCYWVDDQTVAKTNGGGTRSPAGNIEHVESNGLVWVRTGLQAIAPLSNAALGDPVFSAPGAKTANTINVAIQLKSQTSANLNFAAGMTAYLATAATGQALTALTIASLAIGTNGLMYAVADSNKSCTISANASGQVDITIGCSGTGTCYLILRLPSGKLVSSAAITF